MEAVGSGEQQEPRKRLRCITVYMSPLCPDLRTRVWLQFVGFPRHLWNETNATGCHARFGGVTHLDAAELRRSGRMVAEARVTRLAEVPKWVLVMEDVGGGHGIGHCVPLVILSAEPVFAGTCAARNESACYLFEKKMNLLACSPLIGMATRLLLPRTHYTVPCDSDEEISESSAPAAAEERPGSSSSSLRACTRKERTECNSMFKACFQWRIAV